MGELKLNSKRLNVKILIDDIKNVKQLSHIKPELIVCCGDTISHLDNTNEINNFISDISETLITGGKLILSFRDYSEELTGDKRFIPVKSDEGRILTCMLEYERESVRVTDLFYEKTESGWIQRISSYNKVRISTDEVIKFLEAAGFKIHFNKILKGMSTIIAAKI